MGQAWKAEVREEIIDKALLQGWLLPREKSRSRSSVIHIFFSLVNNVSELEDN
jgi:hypothetical protein